MAYIIFGRIDKKLIFLVFITIIRTINLVISNEVNDDYSNGTFCSLEEEIGPIITSIIMFLIFRNRQKDTQENKRHFKYIIYLFLMRGVKSCYEKLFPYFEKEKKYKFNNILNTVNGVEMILMTVGTFLLLKYKYYKHHIISMIIFCILGIVSDFILGNFFIMNYSYSYIYIPYIINDVMIFCYLKYMMDKLYYHYIEILLHWGLTGFIVKMIIFFALSIHEYKNDIDGILNGIYTYFHGTSVPIIIFLQFFYYLFDGGIYFLFIVLMLYYLKPNHMIITDEIHVYLGLIFYKDKPNKYYTLISFVLQILALLIYFEIIELNFCDLNLNTIKNIRIREGSEDITSVATRDSKIELSDQYYLRDSRTSRTSRTSEEGINKSSDNLEKSNDNIDKSNLLIEHKNIESNCDIPDEINSINKN